MKRWFAAAAAVAAMAAGPATAAHAASAAPNSAAAPASPTSKTHTDPRSATRVDATAGLTPQAAATMRAQEPLLDLATYLQTLPGAAAHFAAARLDVDHHSVFIAWHGAVPAPAQARIDAARKAGIQVTVTAADFSRQTLDREIDRLTASLTRTGHAATSSAAQRVEELSPASDGSGIDVEVSGYPIGTRTLTARAVEADVPALASSVPLHIQAISHATAPAATLVRFGRQDDISPYWGGDAILNSQHSLCSTGFAVYTSTGGSGILTAAHCGWDNFTIMNNGNSVGRTVASSSTIDAQVISALSGPFIWDGDSIVGPNQFDKPVSRAIASSVGQYICSSPAPSGVQCGIHVLQVDTTVPNFVSHADYASRGGYPFVGPGDSGGPMFTPASDGSDWVQGTIVGGPAQSYLCPGWQGWPGSLRRCSDAVWYADWYYIASTLGVSLKTY